MFGSGKSQEGLRNQHYDSDQKSHPALKPLTHSLFIMIRVNNAPVSCALPVSTDNVSILTSKEIERTQSLNQSCSHDDQHTIQPRNPNSRLLTQSRHPFRGLAQRVPLLVLFLVGWDDSDRRASRIIVLRERSCTLGQ